MPTDPFKTIFHRNGEVTYWNVYTQSWQRLPAREISSRILATLSEKERLRVCKIAKRLSDNELVIIFRKPVLPEDEGRYEVLARTRKERHL